MTDLINGRTPEGIKQSVQKVTLSSNNVEWATPEKLFRQLDDEFHFTLDPCCTHENAKCEKHYTINDDGLAQDWTGEVVFCNPPYGRGLGKWIEKCAKEKATCVALLPVRTNTIAFHEHIIGNPRAEMRFVKGKLKFGNAIHEAPFASVVVVFRNVAD